MGFPASSRVGPVVERDGHGSSTAWAGGSKAFAKAPRLSDFFRNISAEEQFGDPTTHL